VIRFTCPDCGRAYILADALAHLPIICKGCGRRLTVPEPTPEPPPEPPPKPKPRPEPAVERPAAPPKPPPTPEPPVVPNLRGPELPAAKPEEVVELFLSPDTLTKLDPQPELSRQPVPDAKSARARKVLAWVVDGVLALLVLAAGALVGELVARKPTRDILSGAASAPTFPPTDLLLWLGCVAVFELTYVWLGTRGWTAGGWLRRRASS
jgi:hypothetical protein